MPATERSPIRALWLPAVSCAVMVAFSFTPRVQASVDLVRAIWIWALVLAVWTAALAVRGDRSTVGRVDIVLRSQHWIQALCQVAVLTYWGWYWRPVYDMGVLIGAQLAFAYGFSALLAWSRGQRYRLGFGPFPIILSINLFLWFRDDWFYLQFLMIAIGFLGKEVVRWNRDGGRTHVFNPSAFALGLFSLGLIATGTTDLTWGQEIASTLTLAPRIYLFLFLVGLVVMYFFSITLVAGTAALVLFGGSALYSAWTGVPYFVDSEIPAAVFLGLHLLITDPSTSPRTNLGKAMFGALYGVGVFALYSILGAAGAPTFYDKLLCVPLLNLGVRGIDHVAGTLRNPAHPSGTGAWSPRQFNLALMGVWIGFFGLMAATGRTDGTHRGDRVPFWENACAEGRPRACERLLGIETNYCRDNSAWACNEVGRHHVDGTSTVADASLASAYFARACELRFQAACLNLLDPDASASGEPGPLDLRLLLREGGLNLMQMSEADLMARACRHEWSFACTRLGRGS